MMRATSNVISTTVTSFIIVAEIGLFSSVAQGATTTGGGNAFDNIRSLADDAEAESTALYRDLDVKQGEITSLATRLNACLEGSQLPLHPTPAPFSSEEEFPPTTPSPEQPEPVEPTPGPTPVPMPIHEEEEEDTPGGDEPFNPSPLRWVPRVGDTWNYNLDTPVDTSADVDVFFIDMGKFSDAGYY